MSLESKLTRAPCHSQLTVDYGGEYFFMDELAAALPDVDPAGGAAGFEPLPARGQKQQRTDGGKRRSHSGQVAALIIPPVPPRGMKLPTQVIF